MKIALPEAVFDRLVATRGDDAAAAFARHAPRAVDEILNLWDLEPIELLEGATSSLVVLAAEHRLSTVASHVVKVPFVRRRVESDLLARIGPPLVPQILGASDEAIVMRFVPHDDRPLDANDLAWAWSAWQKLGIRGIPGLTPLTELMHDRARRYIARGGEPAEAQRALDVATRLANSSTASILHGDLHDRHLIPRPHGAVITDPIGVIGDALADAALACVLHQRGAGLAEARAAFLAAGCEPLRLDGWINVFCVLERGGGTADDALLADYAAA
jgi:hypothetical protein